MRKIRAAEFDSKCLAAKGKRLQSPHWHKTVLENRLAKVEAGKAQFLTIEQLKKRLAA
jgi:hypothetical protein